MSYSVKYFIWGYQVYYWFSAEFEAKRLLSRLDSRFNDFAPKVYLVGRRIEREAGCHPICTVPDDCPYQPDLFAGLDELATELEVTHPDRDTRYSDPISQERAVQSMKMSALRSAVLQKIEAVTDATTRTWVSWPTKVNNYHVMLVLQLSRSIYDSHYRLTRDSVHDQSAMAFGIPTSLLSAAITEYLDACEKYLRQPNPGSTFQLIKEDEELLRRAAKQLMYAPAWAGGNLDGLHGLFEACNAISTLKYEGKEGVGRLALAGRKHPAIRVDLELLSPVPIRDYGAVRKLLQLATEDQCLLYDGPQKLDQEIR